MENTEKRYINHLEAEVAFLRLRLETLSDMRPLKDPAQYPDRQPVDPATFQPLKKWVPFAQLRSQLERAHTKKPVEQTDTNEQIEQKEGTNV